MRFQTEEEIDQLLSAFEAGTLPKAEWTHKAHLAIAGAYVWHNPDSALLQVRFGILLLNRYHHTHNSIDSGYHETLTVFWVSVVREFCKSRKTSKRLKVINEMIEALPAGMFKQFYGFDVVKSRKARERWVPPDIQGLPGDEF